MDLQISVFLLFSLFTAGESLSCYECQSGSCSPTTCSSGYNNCYSTAVVDSSYNINKARGCVEASGCFNGFVNLGSLKTSTSCCNTDLCNSQDAPAPSNILNGKKCYSCDGETKDCTKVLSCSGTEDHCFTGTVNQILVLKGCASKSYCDAAAASGVNIGDLSCCEGNLCNGAPSVSQSFLFLCCSLLSYFLLH